MIEGGSGKMFAVTAGSTGLCIHVRPSMGRRTRKVLTTLKVPTSGTVGVFCGRVVLRKKLPFRIGVPSTHPMSIDTLSRTRVGTRLRGKCTSVRTNRAESTGSIFTSVHGSCGL